MFHVSISSQKDILEARKPHNIGMDIPGSVLKNLFMSGNYKYNTDHAVKLYCIIERTQNELIDPI